MEPMTPSVPAISDPPKTPPGRGLLSPSTASYTVEEGALVLPDITCAADCNPACTVQVCQGGRV